MHYAILRYAFQSQLSLKVILGFYASRRSATRKIFICTVILFCASPHENYCDDCVFVCSHGRGYLEIDKNTNHTSTHFKEKTTLNSDIILS